jgi:hypothetical protein
MLMSSSLQLESMPNKLSALRRGAPELLGAVIALRLAAGIRDSRAEVLNSQSSLH